jgi:hypothetical protein
MLLSSQHFVGRGVCWSFRMGTMTNGKQVNYSHGPTQTKQQVGKNVVGTLLVHRRTTNIQRFIRLTTTWI